MNPAHPHPSLEEVMAMSPGEIVGQMATMGQEIDALKHQLDWFRRQIFGQKSERRLVGPDDRQLSLGEILKEGATLAPPPPDQTVGAHRRRPATRADQGNAETLPFFDAGRVPMEVIELPNPDIEGLSPDQYEIVAHKESYRLAQRPGSYVVIKYLRPVIKRRDPQTDLPTLSCPPAPVSVIDGSRADVSFLAGLLLDKFAYHLPLYRQHQRLIDAGFTVSRPWLTQLVTQAAQLLEPIYDAQLASIRASRVKAMDETPIKAGRAGPGKMKSGYFWPVYGELDEVCFPFCEGRQAVHVEKILGLTPTEKAVLLSDGYSAYVHYAEKTGLTHAQCWAHSRRKFFEAQKAEPDAAREGLEFIGALYQVEAKLRELGLQGEQKRDYRLTYAKPVVVEFFAWVSRQFDAQGLLPSNPLTTALAYVRERRGGLEVFLSDPEVPIDTNHLERALRPIPMGRKSWLFCWTEIGAKYVGIVQSLVATCRLHHVDPYDYLVDVLQRVAQHPAGQVDQLTPRLWRQLFAHNPLRSDLYRLAQ